MEFINIADYTADAVYCYLISGLEVYYDVIIKSKKIEILINVFDNIDHHIGAFGFVVESFGGILKKYFQKLFPQCIVFFGRPFIAVRSVAGLGEVREVLRKIVGAELDDSNYVILTCGHEAVHFVAGIGEDVALVKGIGAVAVLKQYLAFKNQHKLSILMVVDRILPDVGNGYIDGKIILICYLFKKHLFAPCL